MERVQLTEDLAFSRVVHGLWRLADWKQSKEETLELLKFCLEQGITTFDHADIYGSYRCEELFGQALALQPSLREQMEIVTKCGIVLKSANRPQHKSHHYNTSKAHIIESVENSLRQLRTDYIDVLLIHRPDPMMNPEEVASAFSTLKSAGKVRHFGVSNFKNHQYTMLQSYVEDKLITNQIEVSPYQLENMEDGTLNFCLEQRIAPMAWSPLAGGALFKGEDDKSLRIQKALTKIQEEVGAESMDEVAYAWLFAHPAQIMPIVGSSQKDRITKAVKALDYQLTLDQWFEVLHSSMGHDVP
ncbi:aldo/keto reductase [Halalkalibacter okhensis]|uniref:Oxidoreductase n=1 Tax=Halalkalibacter okhensis TaxID=333138 RepID=A0A0B0IFE8_9BACI|nr:aldo/keto reductase family oxidoreductase [Halalkalibacter okhensis]KHF41303.1 oxidoreductase [Halalkalibacter okhensis]